MGGRRWPQRAARRFYSERPAGSVGERRESAPWWVRGGARPWMERLKYVAIERCEHTPSSWISCPNLRQWLELWRRFRYHLDFEFQG